MNVHTFLLFFSQYIYIYIKSLRINNHSLVKRVHCLSSVLPLVVFVKDYSSRSFKPSYLPVHL